jgi:hypothetical protein
VSLGVYLVVVKGFTAAGLAELDVQQRPQRAASPALAPSS